MPQAGQEELPMQSPSKGGLDTSTGRHGKKHQSWKISFFNNVELKSTQGKSIKSDNFTMRNSS
jgi:hypothetical protein